MGKGSWKHSGALLTGMLFVLGLVVHENHGNGGVRKAEYVAPSYTFETDDITDIISHADSHTLVLIDLDNTTFHSKTQLGGAAWCYHLRDCYVEAGLTRGESIDQVYPHFCDVQRFVEVEFCDERLPAVIEQMEKSGATVLGLTHRQPIIAKKTLELIDQLGIHFGDPQYEHLDIAFDTESHALFAGGVIFCGDKNCKGKILHQFLEQTPTHKINKIVFVDDVLANVHAVERGAFENNLVYVGVRYSREDKRVAEYNHDIASVQERHLHGVISDHDAARLLATPEGQVLLAEYVDPIAFSERVDRTLVPAAQEPKSVHEPLPTHDVDIEIVQTNTIADVLKYADADTLVVFDLNDTLMSTSISLGGDVWAKKLLTTHTSSGMSKAEALDRLVPFWHQVLLKAPVTPVEPNTPLVLRELQMRGCKMLGLTARYVEMAYATIDQLRSIYIDFGDNPIARDDFAVRAAYPSKFINGVVFAGLLNDKAEVLVQFLKQNPGEFSKLVFVDDKKKNVDGMINAARALNKPYVGIWYGAAEANARDVDPNIAKVQSVLFGKIMPDDVAAQLID